MQQVSVGETDVLLARVGDDYHAVYAYCSHYGAPLEEGALSGDRVVCPWHHACFHLASGHQLEPPGADGLARFDVRVEGEDLYVTVPDDFEPHPVAEMVDRATPSGGDEETYVVLGGGAAGAYAAEAIREAGFDGRLVMLTADHFNPYDRINLSKAYLEGAIAQAEDIALRDDDFYEQHAIEVRRGVEVEEVDAGTRTITLADGEEMRYDRMVLCTGSVPRTLGVPGADLANVHTLRDISDSDALREKAEKAERVVIVGASFIGMECASSLRALSDEAGTDLSITVVAPEEMPFGDLLGEEVGSMLRDLHETNGIDFRLGEHVAALRGDDAGEAVREVELDTGQTLPADLVVVGIGVRPATDMLTGVTKAEDGGVLVDDRLRAMIEENAEVDSGLYAAGDVARFPDWRTGALTRIEHWRLACQHGRLAGFNAAGRETPFRSVPYFWTAQHGLNLRYVGHAEDWDEVILDGDVDPDDPAFIAYYVQDGTVRAALSAGRDAETAALEELMRRELLPTPDDLRSGDADLMERLRMVD